MPGFLLKLAQSKFACDFIKDRKPVEEEKLADLPEDRVLLAPPFTHFAVDYFGPWYMEERRCELKRYGELFTYMSSRAIHLEVSYSMTLNSFISAYHRFVGCRGPFRQIQSDQGTNILGAKNELQLALSELDHDKIKQEPLKRNSDWVHCKTNAPKVCHMGGSWRNCAKHEITCRSPASWFLSPWRPLLQKKMAARSVSCKWILGEVEGWVPAIVAGWKEIGQTVDKSEKWWRCHPEGRIHSTKQLAAGPHQSNLSKWRWHISKGWSRSPKRFPRSYQKENKAHSLSG